jgi:hypothetical protein
VNSLPPSFDQRVSFGRPVLADKFIMLSPRERNIARALARGRLSGRRNKEWACLISRVTTRERGDETHLLLHPPLPLLLPVLFFTAARGNRRTNFAIRISISPRDLARTDARTSASCFERSRCAGFAGLFTPTEGPAGTIGSSLCWRIELRA